MFKTRFSKTALALTSVSLSGLALAAYVNSREVTQLKQHSVSKSDDTKELRTSRVPPPTREELLTRLGTPYKSKGDDLELADATSAYDLIVVGGGATGTGTALDATTRGLKVLLLEKTDFASGTSSKSTKMAHGGVRYLEKAIFQVSKAQLDLVVEALNERASILNNAPHLSQILPILIPVYKYWQLPYFFAGCLLYDLFAGSQALRYSYVLSARSTLIKHPQLDPQGLVGGLVYHDGLFNDARLNSTLALTALENGATILNYMDVTQLLKVSGKVKGVKVTDRETGNQYLVSADAVINATGPLSDKLLEMSQDPQGLPLKEPAKPRMVVPSGGVHVVLPDWYCSKDMGLLDPSTPDGRVMFFLPWQGKVIAGTTDTPFDKVPETPVPSEVEIQDILDELRRYVSFPVKREDVLSAWCGVRPLVRDPSHIDPNGETKSTQGLVRSHLVYVSPSDLITISGGKWTTYREMAEDVVNKTIELVPELQSKVKNGCVTKHLKLVGANGFDHTLVARLSQHYHVPDLLSNHLANNYGDRAPLILELYKKDKENRLPISLVGKHEPGSYEDFDHPFTVAELKYSIVYEYARHPIDFLARRCRLAFLDSNTALESVDGVVSIMAKELNWSKERAEAYSIQTKEYIKHMGLVPNETSFWSMPA
ncbi:unnamed protein product [Kuraishia capsulata CBS 1993]|uniref:Glycerol-3-phosphate dehydrogenase n=1 Tax=Kuraishia capsulata CBS 1993 TaxID=1382522 RepID=W6MT54_9ASCO|nr:uncharacterized protein KUCA_T00005918001 [Kuraishia capsulata CBS 1993]CDK29924.1 unnamed protein product [Kuraishia capsulata CBS 1993]